MAEVRGSDATYSPSAASAGDRDEGDDYLSVHGGSSSDIYVPELPVAPTKLSNLFSKAAPEFARLERGYANDIVRFEQLKNKHAQVLKHGTTLGAKLQALEVKLNNSKVLLDDMQVRLTGFLGMLEPMGE